MKKVLSLSAATLLALALVGCAAGPMEDEPASETEASLGGWPPDCHGGWWYCPLTPNGMTWDWGTCDNPSKAAMKKACESQCPPHSLFHAECVVGAIYP